MNWIDYCVAILIILPILATMILGAFLARNGKNAMGKPTIQPFLFFTGKFLLFAVWAIFAIISIFPQFRGNIPLLIQDVTTYFQKLIAAVLRIPH